MNEGFGPLQSLRVTGKKTDSLRDEESRLAGEANPPNRRVIAAPDSSLREESKGRF